MKLSIIFRGCITVSLIICCCRSSLAVPIVKRDVEYVLLSRFESVVSVQTNFLRDSINSSQLPNGEIGGLNIPFDYFLQGLRKLRKDFVTDLLAHSDAVFVGASNFSPPVGLGVVHSKRCYIVILDKSNKFQLRDYFSDSPMLSVPDAPVWKWSASLNEFGEEDSRPSLLFAAQIAQSYVLISNDMADIQAIGKRLASPDIRVPEAISTRELYLADKHVLWGYRQYRPAQDPTAAGTIGVTSSATALIIFLDEEKRTLVLRLLASPSDQDNVSKLTLKSNFPSLSPVDTGVWETSIRINDDQETNERLFFVMWRFGFGAYI